MDPAERDGSEMYVDRDRRGDLLVIRMLYIAAKSRADTGFQRNQRHHQRRDLQQCAAATRGPRPLMFRASVNARNPTQVPSRRLPGSAQARS